MMRRLHADDRGKRCLRGHRNLGHRRVAITAATPCLLHRLLRRRRLAVQQPSALVIDQQRKLLAAAQLGRQGAQHQQVRIQCAGLLPVIGQAQAVGGVAGLHAQATHQVQQQADLRLAGSGRNQHDGLGQVGHARERETAQGECRQVRQAHVVMEAGEVDG
ncbi:hypothetical protein G6F58_013252 [Rhizopus delemar]|nr:hypothetical protein G6F58_013252 [Rhizopus delemar]